MCYNQTVDISTLDGTSLKLVDKFTYLGSSVSSTEKDIDTRLTKAWTAIDRLSIIWKSDLTDKMKRNFFQAAVVRISTHLTHPPKKKQNSVHLKHLWPIEKKKIRKKIFFATNFCFRKPTSTQATFQFGKILILSKRSLTFRHACTRFISLSFFFSLFFKRRWEKTVRTKVSTMWTGSQS